MAKYIDFTPDVFAKMENGVHVWRFPASFSQVEQNNFHFYSDTLSFSSEPKLHPR